MSVTALQQVGGFNSSLMAGEEPEMCVRLRQQGWKIWRIDADMTIHDCRMTKFSQWWRRSWRGGYAYAEGAWLHGRTPERHWVKESLSIWFWGLFLPLLSLSLLNLTHGLSLLLLTAYPFLLYRIYGYMNHRGYSSQDSWLYGLFCLLGKFPQLQGQIQFFGDKLFKTNQSSPQQQS